MQNKADNVWRGKLAQVNGVISLINDTMAAMNHTVVIRSI